VRPLFPPLSQPVRARADLYALPAARDWVIVWRAMLSLASFVVSHSIELRSASEHLDTLISQVRSLSLASRPSITCIMS